MTERYKSGTSLDIVGSGSPFFTHLIWSMSQAERKKSKLCALIDWKLPITGLKRALVHKFNLIFESFGIKCAFL